MCCDRLSHFHSVMRQGRWILLPGLLLLAGGCATAELTQRTVADEGEHDFKVIVVAVSLSDPTDGARLANDLFDKLGHYDIRLGRPKHVSLAPAHDNPGTALLTIEETDRRMQTGVHRRTYGRTSLTQMRGRKTHEAPVIGLRVTLIDAADGQSVFQADYVTSGPWYADSADVVAAVADTLVEHLVNDGFITAK